MATEAWKERVDRSVYIEHIWKTLKKFSSVISTNTDLVAKAESIEYELIQKATTEESYRNSIANWSRQLSDKIEKSRKTKTRLLEQCNRLLSWYRSKRNGNAILVSWDQEMGQLQNIIARVGVERHVSKLYEQMRILYIKYQKIYADIKRLPQYPRKPTPMHAATNVSMHQKNAVYHHGKKVTHNFSTNPAPSRAKTSTPPNTLRNHEQQQPQRMQRNGKRYLNPVIARTTHTYGTPSAHATYNVAKTEPVDQKRMRRSAPMPHNAPELSGPTNPAFQIHNQTLLSQTQNSVFTMLQPPLQPPIKQYPTPPPLQQTRNINLNSSVIKPPLSTHGGKAFVRPPGIPNDPPTRTLPVPEQKPKGPPKKSPDNPRASPDTGTDGVHDAKRKKTEAETKPEAKIEIHEQVDQANANLTQLFQSMLKEPRWCRAIADHSTVLTENDDGFMTMN